MLNSNKTWQEEVDRLEMNDRVSKGCSVCLAEMMGGENMDILYNFITDLRKRDMELLSELKEMRKFEKYYDKPLLAMNEINRIIYKYEN